MTTATKNKAKQRLSNKKKGKKSKTNVKIKQALVLKPCLISCIMMKIEKI